MKKLMLTAIAGLTIFALSNSVFAADTAKGKEKTITGEAKCAKCMLKESDTCQTVIQAEGKDGKMVTYWLADNDVAKNFHENVCHAAKKVTATGVVKKVHGKEQLTATKIDVVAN
jgi:hypothetical protein